MKPMSSSVRSHAMSAGIGGLYVFLLHLTVWLGYAVAYLTIPENGNHLPKILVPAGIMLVGVIAFAMVKSLPAKPLTFFGTVLLSHILLSVLFLGCGGYLTLLLQDIKGVYPPVDSPDGDLSWIYALVDWLLLAVGMGLLLLLLTVIFSVQNVLKKTAGPVPKEKKKQSDK